MLWRFLPGLAAPLEPWELLGTCQENCGCEVSFKVGGAPGTMRIAKEILQKTMVEKLLPRWAASLEPWELLGRCQENCASEFSSGVGRVPGNVGIAWEASRKLWLGGCLRGGPRPWNHVNCLGGVKKTVSRRLLPKWAASLEPCEWLRKYCKKNG